MEHKWSDHFSGDRKVVCIQGLGFVGSAMSAAVSSAKGSDGKPLYNVVGIDVPNEEGYKKVNALNDGIFPFENSDKKLDKTIKEAIENGNLYATTDAELFCLADTVVVDINLDISYNAGMEPFLDLSAFRQAIRTIGSRIKPETLVLVETTVPPGTCEKVVLKILSEEFEKRGISSKPFVAHSYERVMPGENYLDSIINFWRVYSGVDDESADMCRDFLTTVIRTDKYPLTRLEKTTATETAKVLENSYRATTIAFMEEWGRFAEAVGVDLFEVIDAIRMRPTHSNMRQPGFGVGGYCLTKDPYFARLAAADLFGIKGMDFPFSSQAVITNRKMPLVSLDKTEEILGGLNGKTILLLGISYRQDVGDTRYSPSETFAREAIKRGAVMSYQDPLVSVWKEMDKEVEKDIPDLGAFDAVVFAVPHSQYQSIDFDSIKSSGRVLIFDANRVLTGTQIGQIEKNDCLYFKSIGRG
ncbi:MAG: nucleotide sugar dehydrogenase [Lachnospiraceae bacterium]|nr:nucleotide sugar dehydrogenase [Lachnospiraceae bacterium]